MLIGNPKDNAVSEAVIGCAIEVHRHLGPGLLESVYEAAMAVELELRQLALPTTGLSIRCTTRASCCPTIVSTWWSIVESWSS